MARRDPAAARQRGRPSPDATLAILDYSDQSFRFLNPIGGKWPAPGPFWAPEPVLGWESGRKAARFLDRNVRHTSTPQQLGDAEGKVEGLAGVQPGVAGRRVADVEVGLEDLLGASQALGDVVAGQLRVHAPRPRACGSSSRTSRRSASPAWSAPPRTRAGAPRGWCRSRPGGAGPRPAGRCRTPS